MELRCEQYDDGWCADHASTSTDPAKGCDYARMVAAEAAIQRVRGICEVIVENAHQFYEVWDEDPTAAQVPYGQRMVARHILRALEGDSDD